MRRRFFCGLLLLLPMLLTGCCTYVTVNAGHAFRHDHVQRVERAELTSDGTLILLVEGSRAESSRVKKFTVSVTLPITEYGVWVPQKGMVDGWDEAAFGRRDALAVAIAPTVVLPAYQSPRGNQERLPPVAGAERILYLIHHEKPDRQSCLFYVDNGEHPRRVDIGLDGREVTTPGCFPLLLLTPLAFAVDVVTFPFQIYFLSTMGDRPPVATQ